MNLGHAQSAYGVPHADGMRVRAVSVGHAHTEYGVEHLEGICKCYRDGN